MQEKQVTIGDQTFKLEEPFLVLATQNPDRTGRHVSAARGAGGPLHAETEDRLSVARRGAADSRTDGENVRHAHVPAPWSTPKQILKAREVINDIYVDDKVKDYIVDLVCATRDPDHYKIAVKDFIQLGASPRATISLTLAAKAYAFLKGRGYVTPQDVKSIGMDVLRHRVAITYEAEAEEKTSETVIQKIFDELPVP